MEGETCGIECLSTWELSIGLVRYTRRNTYLFFVNYITLSSFHIQTTTMMGRGDTTARCWETVLVYWYSFYTGAHCFLHLWNHWLYLSRTAQIKREIHRFFTSKSICLELYCICVKKNCIKAFVAEEGAEQGLMNVFKRCHLSQGRLVLMTTSLKNEKKKKKEKSCVVRQLQSCHIVQTIRAAQWGKKRACQPPTCNSESEMLGISEDCDISHLAEWVKDTITKPPPSPQSKDSLYIFQSAQVVNWFTVCVTKTTRAGRLCYQQQT